MQLRHICKCSKLHWLLWSWLYSSVSASSIPLVFFHLSLPKWDCKRKSLNVCQLATRAPFSFFWHWMWQECQPYCEENFNMLHQSVHLSCFFLSLCSTFSNSCLLIRIEIMGVIKFCFVSVFVKFGCWSENLSWCRYYTVSLVSDVSGCWFSRF